MSHTQPRLALFALAGALLSCGAPAMACTPIPPPLRDAGESEGAYAQRLDKLRDHQLLEGQARTWDNAVAVALVRIEHLKPYRSGMYEGMTGASVKALRWLKGPRGRIGFMFRPIGACFGEDTIANGDLGEECVVFFANARPSRKAILDAWPINLIRDRRILEAAESMQELTEPKP